MSQSLVQVYLHIVFSTKDRWPFLRDQTVRDRTHAYLVGICKNQRALSLKVGGTTDHVHILSRLSKTLAISGFIQELESSKWVKQQSPELSSFYWQAGYGAFSVSPSHVDALVDYIENQEEHHRHESFQDEFRRLCEKYGLELDERYAWD